MNNRQRVLKVITEAGDGGLSLDEIVAKTGLDRWVAFACVWLEIARLTVVRPADPLEVRWRLLSGS